MKTLTLLITLILSASLSPKPDAEINKEVTVNGLTYLYGEINRDGLTSDNYNSWFSMNYNRHKVNTAKIAEIKKGALNGVTIKLLMATWCGDSKRNVPVFYKTMDAIGFDENNLQVWALDRRKQGPNDEQKRYGVTRVPTIIFYRDDVEIGRFVERPKPGQNLEDILLNIING